MTIDFNLFRSLLPSVVLWAALLVPALGLVSCGAKKSLHSVNEREMTVGIVQRDIRNGMSQADVAQALGSPNIVTRDSEGFETWIYDKIASEASYSGGQSGTGLILSLFWEKGKVSSSSASTQKTLTVVIKFDEQQKVKTFTYHSTKF